MQYLTEDQVDGLDWLNYLEGVRDDITDRET